MRRLRGDRQRIGDHADDLGRIAPDVSLGMIPMSERDALGLMETFRGAAGRVVATSSGDVYRAYDRVTGRAQGPSDPAPLTEDSPLRDKLYPHESEGDEEYEKVLVERAVASQLTVVEATPGERVYGFVVDAYLSDLPEVPEDRE